MFTNINSLCYNAQYQKAVKETPYAESDRKLMSPTESISMEEPYNGEHSGAGLLNTISDHGIQ